VNRYLTPLEGAAPRADDSGDQRPPVAPCRPEELAISTTTRRLSLLAFAPAVLLGLSACSSTVSSSEMESQVGAFFESNFGDTAEVSCPDDLEAEVDASTTCDLTVESTGEEAVATVTITSIEDNTAQMEVTVDAA